IDVIHSDRALEARHLLARHQLAALLQCAAVTTVSIVRGGNEIEARRSPGLEGPTEYGGVELAGPGHVVRIDGKEIDVIGHGSHCTTDDSSVSCARLTMNVARPSTCGATPAALGGAGALPRGARPQHDVQQRVGTPSSSACVASVAVRVEWRDDGDWRSDVVDDSSGARSPDPGRQP